MGKGKRALCSILCQGDISSVKSVIKDVSTSVLGFEWLMNSLIHTSIRSASLKEQLKPGTLSKMFM